MIIVKCIVLVAAWWSCLQLTTASTDPKRLKRYEKLRHVTSTSSPSGDRIEVTFEREAGGHVMGEEIGHVFALQLIRNDELLHPGYAKSLHSGDRHLSTDNYDYRKHCYYHGTVKGLEESHVRFSTCNDQLNGYIFSGEQMYVLETNDYIEADSFRGRHIVYRPVDNEQFSADDNEELSSCSAQEMWKGLKKKGNDMAASSSLGTSHLLRKRREVKREAEGASSEMFLELMLVTDEHMWKEFEEDGERLEEALLNATNLLDGLFHTMKIRVVLTHLLMWRENPYESSNIANEEFESFKKYRSERLNKDAEDSPWRRSDVAHLIYGKDFSGITIGLAIIGGICGHEASMGIDQFNPNLLMFSATLAHELGHNLGLIHDSDGCMCTSEAHCIMAGSIRTTSKYEWSKCSQDQFRKSLELGSGFCLFNIPNKKDLWGGPKCGNGFVEEGEQCDCGLLVDCKSKCCNATTCMLHPGASCDEGACCDSCQLRASGTQCRATNGNKCDLPEYCNGGSPYCPRNMVVEDGTKCNGGSEYCVSGVCLSYDVQCQETFYKTSTKAPDKCYSYINTQGQAYGNCGRNGKKSYIPCKEEDKFCGKLICSPNTNQQSNSFYKVTCSDEDEIQKYLTIYKDLSELGEAGMVADHTKCGENKWCQDQRCINKTESVCTAKCNGNGVCNTNGNCHCDYGYSPPYCNTKGYGGSLDSGPVSRNGVTEDVVLMLVLFLFVLPVLLGGGVFVWYRYVGGRQQIAQWKQSRRDRLAAVAEMKKRKRQAKLNSNNNTAVATNYNMRPTTTADPVPQSLLPSSNRQQLSPLRRPPPPPKSATKPTNFFRPEPPQRPPPSTLPQKPPGPPTRPPGQSPKPPSRPTQPRRPNQPPNDPQMELRSSPAPLQRWPPTNQNTATTHQQNSSGIGNLIKQFDNVQFR